MADGPTLHWLRARGGFKGGIGSCRGNHGREGWVVDIYGGMKGGEIKGEGRDGYGRDMRGGRREDKYKGKGLVGGE